MNLSQRALAEEDRRAGRIIPGWRLNVTLWVTFLGGMEAANVIRDFGFLWALIPITIAAGVHEILLGGYRKRAIW